MAVPNTLGAHMYNEPGSNPRIVPDYVSARLLAATTAESITIPAGAKTVRVANTVDVFYKFFNGAGNATVPGDVDDGTAAELIKAQSDPEWLIIPPNATQMSVISTGTPIVTASFYV